MKYIRVEMIRDNMDHFPIFSCPVGYSIRTFVPGDEWLWAQVEAAAGEFDTSQEALAHFNTEFGPHAGELKDRCFFLEEPHGNAIGTAVAWYGTLAGEVRGRVHWVGIVPSYPAVNPYLSFGFTPYLGADSGTEGWMLLEEVLHREIL